MTRHDVEELFARRQDAFARHHAVPLAALHSEDGVVDSPMAGGVVQGRRAIEEVYRAFFTAFPDVVSVAEGLLIDGDRVAESLMMTGTDTGGFLGLPPTRKPFRLPMVMLCTLTDGYIVHERRIYDYTGMLMQIGVLKAKPA